MRFGFLARFSGWFSVSVTVVIVATSPAFAVVILNPITTTGFDQDIIVETGLNVGDPAINGEFGSRQFYQEGLQASQPTRPMPGLTPNINGFPTALGNTVNFGFSPFGASNILKFDFNTPATTVKTLTLATPAKYGQLMIAFSGGSLTGSQVPDSPFTARLEYTVKYTGGATQKGMVGVVDWGNNTPATGTERFTVAGRIRMSDPGDATTWNNQIPESDTATPTPNRWAIYMAEFATTQPTTNIESVDFSAFLLDDTTDPQNPVKANLGVRTGGTITNAQHDVVVFGLSGGTEGGSSSIVGDYNNDGQVGVADYVVWRKAATTLATSLTNRGAVTGTVDERDYNVWKGRYGLGPGGGSSLGGAEVPEPTTAFVAVVSLLTVVATVRRRAH